MKQNMKLLNLGCGSHFNLDWVNIDFVSTNKHVVVYNLLKKIPFNENTFDVVYHSHLIEHFSKIDGINFTKECYRVLKPNGIIRIATPNLEEIVKNYIKYLNHSLSGDKIAEFRYDFTMLEMYDQCVRSFNGGELGQWYKKRELLDPYFVNKRTGSKIAVSQNKNTNYMNKKTFQNLKNILSKIRYKASKSFSNMNVKEKIFKIILGRKYKYYELGKFRLSGEVHLWMYDRFSLTRLLHQVGFKDIQICNYRESRIPKWNSYCLDINRDGTAYKPDSIFIEAVK